jgi:hypothetical protein
VEATFQVAPNKWTKLGEGERDWALPAG